MHNRMVQGDEINKLEIIKLNKISQLLQAQ
jgi:hypothetical protein